MLFISKKQLIPTNANLAMVFILKRFQSRFQVRQFKSYGVSPTLFMSGRLRYLLRVCSIWQKPSSGKYVVGNASRPTNNFTFPQSSGKRSLHLIQNFARPRA